MNKNKNLLGFNPLVISNINKDKCLILIMMEKYTMNFSKYININKLKNELYFKNIIYILNEIMKQIVIILKLNKSSKVKDFDFLPLDLKTENIVININNNNNCITIDAKLCDLDGFITNKLGLNRIKITQYENTPPLRPLELKIKNHNRAMPIRNEVLSTCDLDSLFSWYIGTLGYSAIFDNSTPDFTNIDNYLKQLKKEEQNSTCTIKKRFIKEIIRCLHKDPNQRRHFYKNKGKKIINEFE